MKLYLVRHGKTDDSSKQIRQSPHSHLGTEGVQQAHRLAKRIKNLPVDHILSSSWKRALETTKIIVQSKKADYSVVDFIHEQEQNPRIYGIPWDDAVAIEYRKKSLQNSHDLDWKYLNQGESRRDLIQRTNKFLEYLMTHYKDQSVLVVSHGLFISCLVTLCQLGSEYNDRLFSTVLRTHDFKNTSISLLEYEYSNNHWKTKFLNDYSHLDSWPN